MRKTKMHIRLSYKNTETVLSLAQRFNMSHTEIVNQLLERIDPSKIYIEEKIKTVVVVGKELKV